MAKTQTEQAYYAELVNRICKEQGELVLRAAWKGAEAVLGREPEGDELLRIAERLLDI